MARGTPSISVLTAGSVSIDVEASFVATIAPGVGAASPQGYQPTLTPQPATLAPGVGAAAPQGYQPTLTPQPATLAPGAGAASPQGYQPTLTGSVTTYVSDTFTDTGGTRLQSHTPDTDSVGSGWTEYAGTWEIQSNELTHQDPGTGTQMVCGIDAGAADVTITADLTPTTDNSSPGIAFRIQDGNNHWRAELHDLDQEIKIRLLSSGSPSTEASTSYAVSQGQTYELKVVLSGTSIAVYVDGVQELTHTSSTYQSETEHGLAHFAGAFGFDAPTADNFEITP